LLNQFPHAGFSTCALGGWHLLTAINVEPSQKANGANSRILLSNIVGNCSHEKGLYVLRASFPSILDPTSDVIIASSEHGFIDSLMTCLFK
jgi:hypothetical protein